MIAAGLARGLTWKDLGHLGSAAAAFKTTKLEAQAGLPRWPEVVAFLKELGFGAGLG